jgi:cell division septum initiation protein DivIVA
MKKFVLSFLLMAAIGCDSDPSLKQAGDAFEKAGESVDKAFSDIGDEGVRFNDNFNDGKENAADGLADFNQDFNDEEHRFNQRVKDTGAKANADVLDEEARTTGRVKDTLEKANMDAVEEEHRFNDRFKTTTKKANMDTIAEGDKLTDRIVGSDDKTVDQHGDEIRDLQRRMALVEQLNTIQTNILDMYDRRMDDQDETFNAFVNEMYGELGRLENKIDTTQSEVDALELLVHDLTIRVDTLAIEVGPSANSRIDDLLTRVGWLENAVNGDCEITHGTKTPVQIDICDKWNIFGSCTNKVLATFQKQTVTLTCLGKTSQVCEILSKN